MLESSIHSASKQALIIIEECRIELPDIIVLGFDEIANDEVLFTAAGETESGFVEKALGFLQIQL